MRLKHNKKRNTAFVYEALIRELTKSAIKNDKSRINKVKNIMKEHFSKDSVLKRELKIYKSLYECDKVKETIAEKMMIESKIAYSRLNRSKIFAEQSTLIKKINRTLGSSVFSNFVPNYKNLASIYSIFNDSVEVKEKVLLEEKVVQSITSGNNKLSGSFTKDPIDNLVFKSFVRRFNEKYQNKLNESQKSLLAKYVTSFADDGLELKVMLNDQIGELKERIKLAKEKEIISADNDMLKKTNKVLDLLESYKDKDIDLPMIGEVLKIQGLVEEMEKDDS